MMMMCEKVEKLLHQKKARKCELWKKGNFFQFFSFLINTHHNGYRNSLIFSIHFNFDHIINLLLSSTMVDDHYDISFWDSFFSSLKIIKKTVEANLFVCYQTIVNKNHERKCIQFTLFIHHFFLSIQFCTG